MNINVLLPPIIYAEWNGKLQLFAANKIISPIKARHHLERGGKGHSLQGALTPRGGGQDKSSKAVVISDRIDFTQALVRTCDSHFR